MVWIAFDPCYAHPLPEGHRFPMLKYDLIPEQLLYEGTIDQNQLQSSAPVSLDNILACHELNYVQRLLNISLSAQEIRRMGFPLSDELVLRERIIAQGSIDAALSALQYGLAFNVAGGTHHAGSNWAEGFCLLNDQAIAAAYLLQHCNLRKIAIIDLDVHQGNGTAEIFRNEPRVFTCSMHGGNNFPYRKEQSDLDIALPDQCDDHLYLSHLHDTLLQLKKLDLDFLFYQAGVDVLNSDKLGRLALSMEACKERDRLVFQFARNNGVPIMVSMGGGYSEDIRQIVNAHCNTFRIGIQLFS